MRDRRKLIFLHIPKTAGTTLRTIINWQYPPRTTLIGSGFELRNKLRNLPEQRRRKIRVLQGHMPFGLHEYLSGPVDYITILRDPVDRVLSTYCFILTRPMHPLYEEVASMNMSLREFVNSERFPQVSNQQTRVISGGLRDNFSAQALEAAKSNLSTHFSAVGFTERFDESLVLFKRLLGWRNIYYYKRNVTRDRPRRCEIPNSTIRLIEKNNILDMELYEFATQRFNEALSEQGSSFQDEVCNFQRLNKMAQNQ
jgi:hypothetical protein